MIAIEIHSRCGVRCVTCGLGCNLRGVTNKYLSSEEYPLFPLLLRFRVRSPYYDIPYPRRTSTSCLLLSPVTPQHHNLDAEVYVRFPEAG